MTTYHADPAAVRLMQWIIILLTGLLCLAAGIFLNGYPVLMYSSIAFFAGTAAVFAFLIIPLYIRSIRCIVTSAQVTVRYGILMKQERSIRLQNVRFIRMIHGPHDGAWGLNFLVLHVCGGNLAIPFLSQGDRMKLADFLRNKGVFHAP